jgi:hypothetical protein
VPFRDIPRAKQATAALAFRRKLADLVTPRLLADCGARDAEAATVQAELRSEGPLGREHLRIVAHLEQRNIFIVETNQTLRSDSDECLVAFSCINNFNLKWMSVALHARVTNTVSGAQSEDEMDEAKDEVHSGGHFEVIRRKSDKSSTWAPSDFVVKVGSHQRVTTA